MLVAALLAAGALAVAACGGDDTTDRTEGVTLVGPSIDTMVDVTETANPGERSTRWMPVLLAGVQGTMLLAAATLGVFKPGRRTRRPAAATRLEHATQEAGPHDRLRERARR